MIYKNYLALILPICAFFIFFTNTNTEIFHSINNLGRFFPDLLWELLTTFGNKPFFLTILFLVLWKKTDLLLAAFIASVIAGSISSTLKPLFDLARPTDILELSSYHLIGPKISGHSFPSGHTLSAFAIAASLVFYFKKQWLTLTLLGFASFVGLSRIMLGVHWPIDVLMGATIGLACGYAGTQFIQLSWMKKIPFKSYLATILYFLLAIKLFWKGTGYADVQRLVMLIAIAGICLGLWLFFKWFMDFYKK